MLWDAYIISQLSLQLPCLQLVKLMKKVAEIIFKYNHLINFYLIFVQKFIKVIVNMPVTFSVILSTSCIFLYSNLYLVFWSLSHSLTGACMCQSACICSCICGFFLYTQKEHPETRGNSTHPLELSLMRICHWSTVLDLCDIYMHNDLTTHSLFN